MAKDNVAKDLGSLLTGVFQKKNWQRRLGLHQVFLFWDKIVETEIAAHAQPKVIKGDVLWLKVSDSVWMQHLQFEKLSLLDKVNNRLAKIAADDIDKPLRISDIRFDISRTSLKAVVPETDSKPPPVVDAARLAEFDQLLTGVSDPKLKESMRRLWLATTGVD
jgi:hypothetical protein